MSKLFVRFQPLTFDLELNLLLVEDGSLLAEDAAGVDVAVFVGEVFQSQTEVSSLCPVFVHLGSVSVEPVLVLQTVRTVLKHVYHLVFTVLPLNFTRLEQLG